jgi:MFS family permease
MHILRDYLGLAVRPRVRLPLLGSLVGRIPESIASVSLVLLLRSTTGSYASAGVAAAGFALGSAGSAPIAGRALDRVRRGGLLVGLAVGFGCALIAIVVCAGRVPEALIVLLAAVAGAARPPLDAAMRALWPRVVPAERVAAAYSLDATLQELIWIFGPLLLAALLVIGSPSLPLLACAALGVAGTLVFAGGSRTVPGSPRGRELAGAGMGLRSIAFGSLLAAGTFYGVAAGLLTVALSAFATEHHARAAVGVLIAVWGVGSILGGVAYGTIRWRAAPERRAMLLLGALAGLLAVLAAAPGLVALALAMLALGLPLSPWLGTLNEAVQGLVDPARTTEAFTWTYSLITVGIAAGSAAAGPVIQGSGASAGFLVAAASAGAGAVVGAAGLGFVGSRGRASAPGDHG